MKKNLKKSILALLCCIPLTLGLAGCMEGDSAYDIAVKNGFAGTEQEWILSLQGANGKDAQDFDAQALYDAAIANGSFSGTFMEFCKELGLEIPQYNDTRTIAENMLSCVSVYCGFSVSNGYSVSYGYSGGSGVIVDLNKEAGTAYIITNYHVVYNKESEQAGISEDIWVYLCGANEVFESREGGERGDGMKATYYGGAMDYDIAILKVEGQEYLKNSAATEAKLGDSETAKVGEETYVIGNPSLYGMSVTNGILSVQSEYIQIAALDNRDLDGDRQVDGVPYRVMRTSAAINSGNSGGGLFNAAGEVIGIVNAKSSSTTVDNMGYALPISQVKAVCKNIRDNGEGYVYRATLGVTMEVETSKTVIEGDSIQIQEVFSVASVSRNTAASGKFVINDVFLSATLNGETIVFDRYYQLKDFLLDVRLNDSVVFRVKRNGIEREITVDFNRTAYFTAFA